MTMFGVGGFHRKDTEDTQIVITPAFLAGRRKVSSPSLQCSDEEVIEILPLRCSWVRPTSPYQLFRKRQ